MYSIGVGMLVFCPLLLVLCGLTTGNWALFANLKRDWHVPLFGILAGVIWNGGQFKISILFPFYENYTIKSYVLLPLLCGSTGNWALFAT